MKRLLSVVLMTLYSSVCFADMHKISICAGSLQDFPQFENKKMQDYSVNSTGMSFSSVEWSFEKLATGKYEVTVKPLKDSWESKWEGFTCQIGNQVILETKDQDTGAFLLTFVEFHDSGINF